MVWLAAFYQAGTSVTPVDEATSSFVSYIVSFGAIGIFALLAGWLLLKGWRLMSPAELDQIREAARNEGRADLLGERDRVLAEKHTAEQQRDDAMQVATSQLVPLLVSFTAATQALLPLLQRLVAQPGKQLRRGDQGWLPAPGEAPRDRPPHHRESGASAGGGRGAAVRRPDQGPSRPRSRTWGHCGHEHRRSPRTRRPGRRPRRAGHRPAPPPVRPPRPARPAAGG